MTKADDSHLYPRPDMDEFKQWVKARYPFQNHPEKKGDEVLCCNVDRTTFKEVGFRTKRLGVTAFTADGSPLDQYSQADLFPMFINVGEFYKHWRTTR